MLQESSRLVDGSLERLVQVGPDGHNPDTARRWATIYAELIAIAQNGLREAASSGESVPDRLQGNVAALRERLDYWYRHHWQLHGMVIDPTRRSIEHRDRTVFLTGREYQLMSVLLANPGRRFPSDHLVSMAWHEHLSKEQLRTYIGRLRKHLAGADIPCRIDYRPRLGYTLLCE